MAEVASRWQSDVVLRDGGTVRIRPIRAADDDALLGLFDRLSDQSIYFRFFSPVPRPAAQQIERLTTAPDERRVGLVAELAGDVVAVARYDRRAGADEAEVAFTVQDDQQGRGLGTIMLEHLAAIARSNGIRRFVAEILPENQRMLSVFRDAGFEVHRAFRGGLVELSFPIDETDQSLAVQNEREHTAEARSVARLLTPRSVAVIGAGRRRGTIGHEIFRNLLAGDFAGRVYPVNRKATSVAGVRAWLTIGEIPDEIDLAVISVPASEVLAVARECAAKSVRGLVVITAGFAETGDLGAERELLALARDHGMRMVGPNCMGIVNTDRDVRLNATFAPFTPRHGRVAFSSQSGALGIELMGQAGALGLGISTFVSVGNKADVSGNDLLQFWEDDPNTDLILLYLESFGNPRKFARLARRISRVKPIIAVKGGRTAAGTRAASSHTAALASSDVAVDALFRQAGVVRVDTLEAFFDTAQVLVHQPVPVGRRVAIVSNGGGPAILTADACEGAGLDVPELDPSTQEALRSFVSRDGAVGNPVDVVASASAETYERTLRTVLDDPHVDALLTIFVPPLVTQADDVARAIVAAARDTPKPVVACFLGHEGIPGPLRATGSTGRSVPSFAFPESAAVALGRAAQLGEWRRRPPGEVPDLAGLDVDAARALVHERLELSPDGAWLDPDLAVRLCACFGIVTAPTHWVASGSGAADAAGALGYPVALKAGSGAIVHKTDAGAVRLGLSTGAEVRDAFEHMRRAMGDAMGGAIVQPMLAPGVETIVGVTHDPSFGPLVLFGMGGVAAELVRDTALRILPLTDVDAAELVRGLRSSPLLFGYRGARPVDVAALEQLLLRVGRMADEIPEIAELDCNPVIVSHAGAIAVDVKVRLVPMAPSAPSGLRRIPESS